MPAASWREYFIVRTRRPPAAGAASRFPGLLERIEDALGLPVAGEYMVGDSMRDLEAASAAGALPALVRTGFGSATEQQLAPGGAVPVFDDLAEFTGWLLRSVE